MFGQNGLNKLDYIWLLGFILDYHHCLTILKVPFLLREGPIPLFAPTNHPRIKCEQIQLYNSFDKILDEDVRYSVAVGNTTVGETRDMIKAFAMFLCVFFIFNLEYPKKLEATFLLIQELFLRIPDKCKVPSKVLKLMSDLKKRKELLWKFCYI